MPTGTLITNDGSTLGAELSFTASSAGTYYFVVSDAVNYSGDNGRAAGDFHSVSSKCPARRRKTIPMAVRHSGQRKTDIELGDLDVYTASITAGEIVIATSSNQRRSCRSTRGFEFSVRPGPHPTPTDNSTIGTELDFLAATSGTYYFVVSDGLNYNAGDNSMAAGDYSFRMAKARHAESG